jgi:hypothetical protein
MDDDKWIAAAERAELRGQLGAAGALLRECLGPLEVSAAVIESEDGGEAIETLIGQVRKFCADAASAGVQEVCRFPDCKCPMDPGPEPDWCARGLPHARGVEGLKR